MSLFFRYQLELFTKSYFVFSLFIVYPILFFSFLNSVFFSTFFFNFVNILKLSVCLFFIYLSVYYTYTTSFGSFCFLLFKLFFTPNYKFSYKFNNPTVYTKNRIKFCCLFPFLKKNSTFISAFLLYHFPILYSAFFYSSISSFQFLPSTFLYYKPFSIKFSFFQAFPFFHFSLLSFTFIYIPLYSICLRSHSELRCLSLHIAEFHKLEE